MWITRFIDEGDEEVMATVKSDEKLDDKQIGIYIQDLEDRTGSYILFEEEEEA